MPLADFKSQKDVVALLQSSLDRGRLGHAYLFTGQNLGELENVGGALAQTLNCPNSTSSGSPSDACGQCVSCRKTAAGNHPDFMIVKPESKLRQIKIGQIVRRPTSPPRVLHELVYQKAVEGGYKVALLVAADRLNEDAANALLKPSSTRTWPDRIVFRIDASESGNSNDSGMSRTDSIP